jgi:hypothetical protein
MAKQQTAKGETARAPYVKPTILTLKVDLSFASSVTKFEDTFALADLPQLSAPNQEPQAKAKASGVGEKTLAPDS